MGMVIDNHFPQMRIYRVVSKHGSGKIVELVGSAECASIPLPEVVSTLLKSAPDCQRHTWSSRDLPHMSQYNIDRRTKGS